MWLCRLTTRKPKEMAIFCTQEGSCCKRIEAVHVYYCIYLPLMWVRAVWLSLSYKWRTKFLRWEGLMSKQSLWCSVLWWFAFLEFKVPFFPPDLLHISALCNPGEGHSIPDHPQVETFTNGIVQCLLKKEIKPQGTGIKGISPYVS